MAGGQKHGYGLLLDIEVFAGVRLSHGTLYTALARLQDAGLVQPLGPPGRRRPYQLTEAGRARLAEELQAAAALSRTGLRRLAGAVA